MRGVAVAVGGLLLVGGAAIVVLADQQRVAEITHLQQQIDQVDARLDDARDENLRLAERLTTVRTQIADDDAALGDTTGFLP